MSTATHNSTVLPAGRMAISRGFAALSETARYLVHSARIAQAARSGASVDEIRDMVAKMG